MPDQSVHVRITTASPLHIGCDEVYEPTSFVIDQKSRELVSFDTLSFLEQLDGDAMQQFSSICRKGTIVSLLELLKFMRTHADLAEGTRVSVSDSFLKHYESTLNLPQNERTVGQELNKFQINRTAFDPLSGMPYIPGSALKGAIRTAILNFRNKGSKQPTYRGRHAGKELQACLLGCELQKLETDPFRLVKISDLYALNEASRRITYAVDRKKKPGKRESQAPYQILEAVEAGAEFAGTITVLSSPGRNSGISRPVTLDEITKALGSFFGYEKRREDKDLGGMGVQTEGFATNGSEFPLRIGRHSGAECVTVNGHRNIKIMQGKGNPDKYMDHATTIWLSANSKKPDSVQSMKPFGWVLLEILSPDEGEKLTREAMNRKSALMASQQEKIAARKEHEEKMHAKPAALKKEEEARRVAEKDEQEAAAEREKKILAAMSEAERCAYIIKKDNTPEEETVAIYNRLDEFEVNDQKIIASSLKEYWKSMGKWKVKKKQAKQFEKVQKVKKILGEASA